MVALTPSFNARSFVSAFHILSGVNSGLGRSRFLNLCEVLFEFKVIHTYLIRICIKIITNIFNWPECKMIRF